MKIKLSFFITIILLFAIRLSAQQTQDIRINQIGYLPNAIKYAAVINSNAESFELKTADLSETVYTGQLSEEDYFAASEEDVKIADFTVFDTPGEYVLVVDDLGNSSSFIIGGEIFTSLTKSTIKAFYYNRASMELEAAYAGEYARPLGHPDDEVVVHPSAASAERPAGTVISTPYGWYDAGDYNKYVVNSGISTFTLLSAYETYPDFYDTLSWNIPESNNAIPDILDEAWWNVKWLMTMQDTVDGGVYNKTTTANFQAIAMPHEVNATRYVVAKGTAATLNFAAIMAMTARIYQNIYPDKAAEALEKAKIAWEWAQSNPNVPFNNPGASQGYPSISTGGYGDENFSDEFAWAAAELYITTGDNSYYSDINLDSDNFDIPGWPNVRSLGLLSLIVNRDSLTQEADTALAKQKLISLIESYKNNTNTTPYRIPGEFFGWGGNSSYANIGMLLMQAFKITGDAGYFNAAVSSMDYLLGRNATTYSFVTGFGSKSPIDIHHRVSGADDVAAPVPGFLVGGPNPGNLNDDCGTSAYPSTLPAKAYLDDLCSYSTNEVTINWNAPMVFLSGAIQYEYLSHFKDSMPNYFVKSTSSINLPSKAGFEYDVNFTTNQEWVLSTVADWLTFSVSSGNGSATIAVSSETDNPSDETRTGVIYIENNEMVFDSIQVNQNGLRREFLLQAESFNEMLGLQTETTSDIGGGLNLGFADPGDWAEYDIDISYAGVYEVFFRHAGQACNVSFYVNDEYLKDVSFPATGDWQDWEEISAELGFEEGVHKLKLEFVNAGLNLNWMRFEWLRELGVDDIHDVHNTMDLNIYPIPARDILQVIITNEDKIMEIELISIHGKTVHKIAGNMENEMRLHVNKIHSGIYYLRVIGSQNEYKKLFIKQ